MPAAETFSDRQLSTLARRSAAITAVCANWMPSNSRQSEKTARELVASFEKYAYGTGVHADVAAAAVAVERAKVAREVANRAASRAYTRPTYADEAIAA